MIKLAKLFESFKFTKNDLQDILGNYRNNSHADWLYDQLGVNDPKLISYFKLFISWVNQAGNNALKILGPVPYYDEKSMIMYMVDRIVDSINVPEKMTDLFPIPIYISSKRGDQRTIGIMIHINGKKEMFEGNDEALDETYALINKILGLTKDVTVWGMHNADLVREIKRTNQLPPNLYISPKKSYAQGYWSMKEDRLLFSGVINTADVRQESDVDWKTIFQTKTKNVRIF